MNTPLSAEQLANWREKLKQGREKLAEHFARQRDPRWVMKRATDMVDVIIREVWQSLALGERAAAIAVGGYGRAQQFPHSDIDLLVLLPENPDASAQQLRAALQQHYGAQIAVIINDSFGRAWRLGPRRTRRTYGRRGGDRDDQSSHANPFTCAPPMGVARVALACHPPPIDEGATRTGANLHNSWAPAQAAAAGSDFSPQLLPPFLSFPSEPQERAGGWSTAWRPRTLNAQRMRRRPHRP